MAASDISTVQEDHDLIVSAAQEAGRIAMRYFRADNRVWTKSGDSPVSQADFAANDHLHQALLSHRPDYGWVSEESERDETRLERERVFVVDPIDGTRGFIAGEEQWSVCVAVIRDGRPEAGVIHCPAMDRTFSAIDGRGAWLDGESIVNPAQAGIRRIAGSKRLNVELARRLGERVEVAPFIPSLACRVVMVANGELDGALARPGAHDWDIAAADVILTQAGGSITGLDGRPLRYNRPRLDFPSLLVAGPGRWDALLALAKDGGFLQ